MSPRNNRINPIERSHVSDYGTEEKVAASDEAETPATTQPVEADAGETGTDDWDD